MEKDSMEKDNMTNSNSGVKSKKYKGGSPASNLVMKESTLSIMNDYVTNNRIRQDGYSNKLMQLGGSPSSELVMNNLTATPMNEPLPTYPKIEGNLKSLNLYQTTGGHLKKTKTTKKSKKTKSNKKSKKTKSSKRAKTGKKSKGTKSSKKAKSGKKLKNKKRNKKVKKAMMGGSDWKASQYSLGPINNGSDYSSAFTASTLPTNLLNPTSLGNAGSGYPMNPLEGSGVKHTGAPY